MFCTEANFIWTFFLNLLFFCTNQVLWHSLLALMLCKFTWEVKKLIYFCAICNNAKTTTTKKRVQVYKQCHCFKVSEYVYVCQWHSHGEASHCATSLSMQIPLQESTQLVLCLYHHLTVSACQNLHVIFSYRFHQLLRQAKRVYLFIHSKYIHMIVCAKFYTCCWWYAYSTIYANMQGCLLYCTDSYISE